MKKGLIAFLGTIAFALASFNANANAPFFTKDIPNVVIADDQAEGLTADLNWFRYLNAFNLLDYVNDTDTTNTLLRAAFVESVGYTNDTADLEINGKAGLLTSASEVRDDPSTWGTKELTGAIPGSSTEGDYWLSFEAVLWNIKSGVASTEDPTAASPYDDPVDESGSPVTSETLELLPWHNNLSNVNDLTGADAGREIQIWVADEDPNNPPASDTLTVFALNAGEDDLSGGVTILNTAEFNLWRSVDFTGVAVPTFTAGTAGDGYLQIETQGTASPESAYFGRWIMNYAVPGADLTAPIAAIDGTDLIYGANFSLEAVSQPDSLKAYMPDIRYGATMGDDIITNMLIAKSATVDGLTSDDGMNPFLPGIGESKDFNIFWAPHDWTPNYSVLDLAVGGDMRTWRLFFDVLDINTVLATQDAGAWRLDDYNVVSLAKPALDSGATSLNTNAAAGWEISGTSLATPAPIVQNATFLDNTPANGVTLQCNATASEIAYIIWENPRAVDWEADKLLRQTASLQVPAASDTANMDKFRMRVNQRLQTLGQLFIVRRSQVYDTAVDGPAGGTQPVMPIDTAATDYVSYMSHDAGPSDYIINTILPAFPGRDLDKFDISLDFLMTRLSEPQTQLQFNSLLVEVLDEPDLN